MFYKYILGNPLSELFVATVAGLSMLSSFIITTVEGFASNQHLIMAIVMFYVPFFMLLVKLYK